MLSGEARRAVPLFGSLCVSVTLFFGLLPRAGGVFPIIQIGLIGDLGHSTLTVGYRHS
jgi:hypothetical protein